MRMQLATNQTSHRDRERGVVLLLFTLSLIPLLLVLALAVDVFQLVTVNLQQTNNAEFSAEAAVLQLWIRPVDADGDNCANETQIEEDPEPSTPTACAVIAPYNDVLFAVSQVVEHNNYVGIETSEAPLSAGAGGAGGTLQVGCWDGTNFGAVVGTIQPPCVGSRRAVRVSLGAESNARVVPIFARALGYQQFIIHSSAVAYIAEDNTTVLIQRKA